LVEGDRAVLDRRHRSYLFRTWKLALVCTVACAGPQQKASNRKGNASTSRRRKRSRRRDEKLSSLRTTRSCRVMLPLACVASSLTLRH
jgi:hypothetical protein